MATILVVDDELAIRRLLRHTLDRAGHRVVEAANGRDALVRLAADHPDAVLLDLGLPDRDGLELIPLMLKREGTAVLVVSSRETTDDKVAALDLGADDYVGKPFDSEELLARLRVALRHRRDATPPVVTVGDLTVDLEHRQVSRAGAVAHLTRKEYDVLSILARNAGRVVTHDKLLAEAWAGDRDARVDYLRIVVRNLRQKLEAPAPIGSVIGNELGVGYRLRTM